MIEELIEKITNANDAYRLGNPIILDSEYDTLIEELTLLDPDNEILNLIGHKVIDVDRKRKLEHDMASMNKIKTIDEFKKWIRLKGISTKLEVVCTPKYDGLSLLVNEKNDTATTRGDGTYGQDSDEHYKLINNKLNKNQNTFTHTYGEVIMKKETFLNKYSEDFANPRNLVAGLINSKEVSEPLCDVDYIKYGGVYINSVFFKKSIILKELNKNQEIKVEYETFIIEQLTEEILIDLFKKWSVQYEIDGIIIEINDIFIQQQLGRDKSTNNPQYAVAFKHESFEQKADTEVLGISWNISKQGLLKPIIHLNPVKLDGVTISNVTGNNARFVKDMGIGIGSIVRIVRSGMVIPKIIDIIKTVEFIEPTIDGVDIIWNDAGIELITTTETDSQKLKKIIAFFEILEAENVSEGVLSQLWENGYKSIKDILNLTKNDLEKLDGFGERKSEIVYNSIQKCIQNVPLSKLQHATGLFPGLGSKKLQLLEHFEYKPSTKEVVNIDGFAEISAKSYVDNYDKFHEFIKDLPITIERKSEVVKTSNDLEGMTFVFTGIRLKDDESILISKGAKIGSSVSKNTTHLVCKDPNSGSSKLVKASELGIKIMGVDEFKNFLSNM